MSTKHFGKLRGEQCNWLVPSNVQAMTTAVNYAQQVRDGTITLFYSDDTTESRACDRDMVQAFDGFLSVVAYVQAGRLNEIS